MKTNVLSPCDRISILNMLSIHEQACDSNRIHADATMWCVRHFVIKVAAAGYAPSLYLESKKSLNKLKGMLSFWEKFLHHFFEMYKSDDIITESEMEVYNFKKPFSRTLNQ